MRAPLPAPSFIDERVQVWTHQLATDWGSWELVEASLGGFRRARDAIDPDLVVLVSGQCHPAVDLAAWEREVLASGGWQGQSRSVTYCPRWGGAYGVGDQTMTRYSYRWWPRRCSTPCCGVRGASPVDCGAIAHCTEPLFSLRNVERGRGAYVGLRRARSPFTVDAPCQVGSQWLALDRTGVDQVLTELAPGAALEQVYRHTIIPDESALQTVLARHHPPAIARTVSHRLPEDRSSAGKNS